MFVDEHLNPSIIVSVRTKRGERMKSEKKEIGHEIRSVQQLIHHKIEEFRTENEDTLTFVQARTLCFLLKNHDKDMFQRDLEKELNIRRSTATEILKTRLWFIAIINSLRTKFSKLLLKRAKALK